MPVAPAREVDERALVGALKALRALVEEEHALEVDRAASVGPLAFDSSAPAATTAARRAYVFRTLSQPARGGSSAARLNAGDGIEALSGLNAGDAVEIRSRRTTGDGAGPAPSVRRSARGETQSSLKVGDSVEILGALSERGPRAFGTLVGLTPGSAVVELGRAVAPADVPSVGVLRLHVDDNQRAIRLRAIERVVRERHALHWVGGVLTAADLAPLAENGYEPPADAQLTDGQRRAVVGASSSQDVFLIQGPPGTGKTTVIAALLRYFAGERGARVLLSSKGHRAIDNALDRLGTGDLHVLRVGQSEKVTGVGQNLLLADAVARAELDVPRRHVATRTALEDLQRSLAAAEQILAQLETLRRDLDEAQTQLESTVADIEASYVSGLEAVRQKSLRLGVRSDSGSQPARGDLEDAQPNGQPEVRSSVGADASAALWKRQTSVPADVSTARLERHTPVPAGVLATRLDGGRPSVGGLLAGRLASLGQTFNRLGRAVSGIRRTAVLPGTGQDRQSLYRDAESWVAERRRAQLERPELGELRERIAALQMAHQQHLARAAALFPPTGVAVAGVQVPMLAVGSPAETRASLQAVRYASARLRAVLPVLQTWATSLERPGALADVVVDAVDVLAATAIGVNSGREGGLAADLDFDVAIVDEAGQAQLTDLVVPLSRARTVILVGDHQQLPPYVDDDLLQRCMAHGIDTAWLGSSLFEQLWDRVPPTHRTRLDVQFRMPQAIADFLGQAFYAGSLATAAFKQGGEPVCDLFGAPVVFVDTSGEAERGETAVAPGFLNRCEAQLVAEIVARLPERYVSGEGTGVIAPYAAQVGRVRQALAEALGLAARDAWLLDNVATVDSFQGQERDVILVSLTRSNPSGAVGFLSDLKRLNVTLSRARRQLVVVGDLATLCMSGGAPERRAFAQFVADLAEHVREHGELVELGDFRMRLSR